MIKKVPDGQPSGSAFVSYNEPAFESYGLRGNENSAICANCAKTYVEGLNSLLSSGNEVIKRSKKGKEKKTFRYTNRKNFGSDTAMVFWTRKNEQLPETLSGSAARIAVRDWIETSLFDFKKSIAAWFQDIAVVEYDRDLKQNKTHYTRLYELARSCQGKNSDDSYDKNDTSLARVATYLWNAALKNTSLPLWMLTKVLQRARLDKYGVTADRAALIKLILNRNNKGGGFVITEKMEEGHKPIAYVCGQIFAKLESIQYAALGDRNSGIRERYFTYTMTLPASAFGRLFDLSSKHFTKLKNEKPGLAVTLDKELQYLVKEIDIKKMPGTFSLEEKGQFAIGYYHQKQAQFSGARS
jgi:CRISPR-associated protein Csd1